ncbi:MAG: Uma2 family endonuclease [Spirochaetia bacterium]|nr:Uma2 family endonuclease [Spirochaetia bacterium]
MATLIQNKPLYEGLRVTREEYLDLPDDGFQYDMIEGELHMSPSSFFNHNRVISNFLTTVEVYLKKTKVGGYLAPETDVFLPDGGDVLRPDISFILEKNKSIIIGHIHGTPDLICEVLSDSTRERDLGVKAGRYLSNGVKEYWILNPTDRSIQLWINRGLNWDKKTAQTLASELLAGLQVSVDDIFSGMP